MIMLKISDLKQYIYCPRIVYFQYVMPVEHKTTYKMEKGKIAEVNLADLERRRTFSKYGLDNGMKKFNVRIESQKLGLSGMIDMLIETQDTYYPVDFKFTSGKIHNNHIAQICGYTLILEDIYHKNVNKGFVYLIPQKEIQSIDITEHIKSQTLQIINDIRKIIQTETFPNPTSMNRRCQECEYHNYCNDVF